MWRLPFFYFRSMRNKILIACLLVLGVHSSCDNESSAITAIVDGQLWESDSFTRALVANSGRLIINGESRTFRPMAFSLSNYNPAGDYALDSINNSFLFGADVATGFFVRSTRPGQLTISELSMPNAGSRGSMKATFSLTAFNLGGDSISVSEGNMDLVLSETE